LEGAAEAVAEGGDEVPEDTKAAKDTEDKAPAEEAVAKSA